MTTTRRIAVIGAGPKGLYCLERLTYELIQATDCAEVAVHIFEPHPYPGAGPVYDLDQPDFLRMNFANGKIDMWSREPDQHAQRTLAGPTLVAYLNDRGISASNDEYAPRRLVGSYLHDGFNRVIDALRTVAAVHVHHEAVRSVAKRDGGFQVETSNRSIAFDEVLVASGHGSRKSPPSPGVSPHPIEPYPVDQPGGLCDVAPGSRVAVRGLGLTAIDVALALTEGRGGQFVASETDGRLVYKRSGREASCVLPYSRTGRPMAPKPHPLLMPETTEIKEVCIAGSLKLDVIGAADADPSGSDPSLGDPYAGVVAALIETSASLLCLVTSEARCDEQISAHLKVLLERRALDPEEAVLEMREGIDRAMGQRTPGPDWALGTAWRGIYAALVRLTATRRLDRVWSRFSKLATEMERVAFGPPVENAARLLALVDAGIVDLSCAADPAIAQSDSDAGILLRVGATERRADLVVNAVLDPPGAAPNPAPVVASLLQAGLARTTAHSSGLDVTVDGTCFGVDGQLTVGLAAVGRPTEGSILGNDTLSRTLHDAPAQWAKSVARRALRTMETSAA